MARYGDNVHILAGDIFLSDGVLETELIFREGWDLPHVNAFGGCCGTDHRPVAEICRACLTSA